MKSMTTQMMKRSIRIKSNRSKHHRRGATAVEFSLVFILFMSLFLYGVQIFRISMISNSVDIAIMEGARMGMLPGKSLDDAKSAMSSSLMSDGIRNFDVEAITTTDGTVDTISVGVSISLSDNGVTAPGLPVDITKGTTITKETVAAEPPITAI
jgi:Flp pilus assembly protein TadG